jgi:hypothetical protein
MIVRFKVNLGSNDAAPLRLDFQQCGKGKTTDVSEAAAAWLIKRGIAEAVEVKAVAPKPTITAPAIETKPGPLTGRVKQDHQPSTKGA